MFANPEVASAYAHFCVGAGECIPPAPPGSESFRLVSAAGEHDLKTANERVSVLKRHMEGGANGVTVPARTLCSWLARYRLANEKYGNGYVGLLPKTGSRGNRKPRLPEASRNLLDEFVANDFENLKQKTRAASWAALKRACEERGSVAPSYVTFCLAVSKRPAFEQTFNRQGRRAAYVHSESFEMIRPAEPSGFRRDRLHSNHWYASPILLQTRPELVMPNKTPSQFMLP